MTKKITYIQANIGHCAGIDGCQFSAQAIVQATPSIQGKIKYSVDSDSSQRGEKGLPALVDFSNTLSAVVRKELDLGNFPIILGGDHSSAIGTWSGAMKEGKDTGLIWIDAHMDAHTLESSASKNIHGMPTAVLMGYGDKRLTSIAYDGVKVKPENIVYIGIRSFEKPEQELLKKLNATIYYANDVRASSFKECLAKAVKTFQDKNIDFGISFDMDSLDISEMTALGTPVADGLILNDVVEGFTTVNMTGLRLLEVVEYNATLDETGNDVIPVQKVLQCFDNDVIVKQV